MKKTIFLLVLMIALVGCSAAPPEKKYAVGIYNLTVNDSVSDNKTMTKLGFSLQNQEKFALDCKVTLTVDNSTDSLTKTGTMELDAGETKKGRFNVEMLSGDAQINVKPVCEEVKRE